MADLFTQITVSGLYDNNTESALFGVNGSAAPTSAILIAGSDGTNLRTISTTSNGFVNVNATVTPPSDTIATGTLTNPADTVVVSTTGTSALMVQITGAAITAGAIVFEVSLDGTTWQAANLYPVFPDGAPSASQTATSPSNWTLFVGGVQKFRVRANGTYAGGPSTIWLTAGQGQYSVEAVSPVAANFNATVVGTKTNNNAVSNGGNFPTLPAVATTAAPTYTNNFVVALSTDLAGSLRVSQQGTVTVTGTVSATQGTSPWVENLTQVAGVTLGATAVTNFGTAPAATAVPGTNSSIYAGTTGLTATGTSLNTNITGGTVAVTQSTSPWVVAGNLTHNNAAPAANNIGVLPAVASSAAPTYTAGDQVLLSTDLAGNLRTTGTTSGSLTNNNAAPAANNVGVLAFEATATPLAYTQGNQVLATTSLGGATRVVPVDEANASSLSYYSVDDSNAFVANLVTSVITPLVSIRSSSAAFIYLVRSLSTFTDGSQVLFRLYKNPTLTGATFAATVPTGSHVTFDTAATAVTAGQVVWSGYSSANMRALDQQLYALAAGTPGDIFTLAAEKFGSGTAKAAGALQWSEQSAAL